MAYTFTVGPVSKDEAEAKANIVDYLLLRIRQGFVSLPPGMDIDTFMECDGKPPDDDTASASEAITLGTLRDRYLKVHEGSLEKTTTDGIKLHFKHLVATLGERFPLQELSLAALQSHADRRKVMK